MSSSNFTFAICLFIITAVIAIILYYVFIRPPYIQDRPVAENTQNEGFSAKIDNIYGIFQPR